MNGFIDALPPRPTKCWVDRTRPECAVQLGPEGQPDVMSTQPRRAIPNYWDYADSYVLQDAMFAPVDSWTLPAHLFLVSAWSAACTDRNDPMSCSTDINLSDSALRWDYGEKPLYAWTDVTWLMDEQQVSWRYFVGNDTCSAPPCPKPGRDFYGTSYNRNPLPGFTSFGERDGFEDNVRPVNEYLASAADGSLPAVTWLAPSSNVSDHPGGPSTVKNAMAYVTRLVNAAMEGPDWDSTAIFLTWDDWGGFYDHVQPPRVDAMGLRAARAGAGDQPLREARLRRPHDPDLRLLPQADRGSIPGRRPTRPGDDVAPGQPPDGSRAIREPAVPRVRLQPGAEPAIGARALAVEGTRALFLVLRRGR